MNEFDQFVKHELKICYYARYTDDFVIVSNDYKLLNRYLPNIQDFLRSRLNLSLHPDKISILPFCRGVDFLGQIVLPHFRVLRAKTKKRIFRKMGERVEQYKSDLITEESLRQSLQSYLGVFSHTNGYEVSTTLKNQCWFWLTE